MRQFHPGEKEAVMSIVQAGINHIIFDKEYSKLSMKEGWTKYVEDNLNHDAVSKVVRELLTGEKI